MMINIFKNNKLKLRKNKKKHISANKFDQHKSEFKSFYNKANLELQKFKLELKV